MKPWDERWRTRNRVDCEDHVVNERGVRLRGVSRAASAREGAVIDKPVWMEEWAYDHVAGPTIDGDAAWSRGPSDERIRMCAAAPALVRALLAVEWRGVQVGNVHHCPGCRGAERHGRDYDGENIGDGACQLDAALTLAGFPTQASRDEARRVMREAK